MTFQVVSAGTTVARLVGTMKIKHHRIHISMIALAVCAPLLVSAESLKEKEQRKRETEILQKSAKEMNEACKSNITAVGDWDTFKGALSDDQGHHVGLNCGYQVLDTIKGLCNGSDEAKASVRAGLSTMRCQGGGDADISLKGKVLTFKTRVDSQKSDVPAQVREFLKTKL